MLTRRLIVLLKKARLACSLTYPTFLPSYGPYGPYGPASYVVVLFLPLRPGVTVSGAPAKLSIREELT
ncbi:hypothetical protein L249_1085 [Ophiocordyceps polyrhachis-furcata BCC 54312]|uniref:Uncharacterized protein n=1 Tax=Ophiocordyceps polyrhachis-furcata BCC 54312 TaxID=1330021 RepID=A0A367LEM4_9HYPO|nr:hypothetical protein L249_1085 [Ophiocordyceps polyrhachis-furcata BCC 54312]